MVPQFLSLSLQICNISVVHHSIFTKYTSGTSLYIPLSLHTRHCSGTTHNISLLCISSVPRYISLSLHTHIQNISDTAQCMPLLLYTM
uniref:Uncharacterized protein n=1 Tax=Octopus bimaculoides TaxID=37653 RepID=A0A0L8HM31_OCTBM